MSKPKPMSARYRVEGVNGEFYDVFKTRKRAIRTAIQIATEYPGTTFLVIKRGLTISKTLFRFCLDAEYQFEDLQDVLQSMIDVFQKKLNKTKYWRKSDVT